MFLKNQCHTVNTWGQTYNLSLNRVIWLNDITLSGLPVLWLKFYLLAYAKNQAESTFLPFLRLLERTRFPPTLDMRSRKPCLFFLFLLLGWYVRFIVTSELRRWNYPFLYFRPIKTLYLIFLKNFAGFGKRWLCCI